MLFNKLKKYCSCLFRIIWFQSKIEFFSDIVNRVWFTEHTPIHEFFINIVIADSGDDSVNPDFCMISSNHISLRSKLQINL